MRPPLLALATLLGSLILSAALPGCGRSQGPSLAALPVYLGATQTESMAGSAPGGWMGASLRQYTTTDSFDQVVGFYTQALAAQEPEVANHTTPLGRQTAFTIQRRKSVTSVAVQEFTEEDTVVITLMGAGR